MKALGFAIAGVWTWTPIGLSVLTDAAFMTRYAIGIDLGTTNSGSGVH